MKQQNEDGKAAATEAVRFDKYLWAARFYKTRSLARAAIEGGKVFYNEQRCKPGKTVSVGGRNSFARRILSTDDRHHRNQRPPWLRT